MSSSSGSSDSSPIPSAPPTFTPSQPYVPPQLLTPPPAPRRNGRGLIIGLSVGVAGVLVIVFVTLFLLYTRPSPSAAATWNISISNARATMGDAVAATGLKPSDTYLVIDVAVTNVSASEHDFAGYVDFTVKDAAGTTYQTTYYPDTTPPDGTIPAGVTKSGSIAFEVPVSQHAFTLIYDDPRYSGQRWSVNV